MENSGTIFVAGATGATGRLLVEQLLEQGHRVRAVVRVPEKLPVAVRNHPRCSVLAASLLELSDAEMAAQVHDCEAVASCLGHTLSLRGVYGQPRRLVTEATRRLCAALKATRSAGPSKFVLMNTAGNRNRDLAEPLSFAHRSVVGLLRLVLPPHADNEAAADYLRTEIGPRDPALEWVVVRPDSLIDEDAVTAYTLHPSPTRCAIFDPGRTSRLHVAHFIAELLTDPATWQKWQGQMPVIYNAP